MMDDLQLLPSYTSFRFTIASLRYKTLWEKAAWRKIERGILWVEVFSVALQGVCWHDQVDGPNTSSQSLSLPHSCARTSSSLGSLCTRDSPRGSCNSRCTGIERPQPQRLPTRISRTHSLWTAGGGGKVIRFFPEREAGACAPPYYWIACFSCISRILLDSLHLGKSRGISACICKLVGEDGGPLRRVLSELEDHPPPRMKPTMNSVSAYDELTGCDEVDCVYALVFIEDFIALLERDSKWMIVECLLSIETPRGEKADARVVGDRGFDLFV